MCQINKRPTVEIRKCVFLDRDGVLNHTRVENGRPLAPTSLDAFVLYDDVNVSLEELKNIGFLLIVVTNQPDVGNQKVKRDVVEAMHEYILSQTPIDAVFACFHTQDGGCSCRKPKPGLLYAASFQHALRPSASYMVGDRYSDIAAGNQFGCRSIFIDRSYIEPCTARPWKTVKSLAEAVAKIVENEAGDI